MCLVIAEVYFLKANQLDKSMMSSQQRDPVRDDEDLY